MNLTHKIILNYVVLKFQSSQVTILCFLILVKSNESRTFRMDIKSIK